jgi:thymidine kinase
MVNRWHLVFLSTIACAAFGLIVAVGFKQAGKTKELIQENKGWKVSEEKGWIIYAKDEREFRHLRNFQRRYHQTIPTKLNTKSQHGYKFGRS